MIILKILNIPYMKFNIVVKMKEISMTYPTCHLFHLMKRSIKNNAEMINTNAKKINIIRVST